MKRHFYKKFKIFILFSICLMATACGSRSAQKETDSKPVIMVTIEPQRYLTEAIAGDKFSVVSMVPKGSSPETYDPIPQQLVSLGSSKAYFRIGYIGFEQTWMDRLMNNAPHLPVFDTSKGVNLIFDRVHDHSETPPASDIDIHGVEPHIWNSTINTQIIADNTLKALCTLDKANAPYYRARYDSLSHLISETDSLIRKELATPGSAQAFMIYHPALSYFARDYGLKQISIEEGSKEPSPAHMKELIDICKADSIRVIFVQPEFDKRNAETIAQQTGTHVVPINPLSYDWPAEMMNVAKALAPTGTSKK